MDTVRITATALSNYAISTATQKNLKEDAKGYAFPAWTGAIADACIGGREKASEGRSDTARVRFLPDIS